MRREMAQLLIALMLVFVSANANGQEIKVLGFSLLKKKEMRKDGLKGDKSQATIDFITSEKGFTFKADGKTDLTPQEGEDKISLFMPHKTRYLTIKHPDYGELTWLAPVKNLRKKKYYRAILLTSSPKKEYQPGKQWVVFYVEPENAILYADSIQHSVRKGKTQLYLTVGKHNCRIEAPFYEPWEDEVTVEDTARANVTVCLTPLYSYLTVKTPIPDCTIHLDGDSIGLGETISNRIIAGKHRLTITRKSLCYYNEWVEVDSVEKKVVILTEKDMKPTSIPAGMSIKQLAEAPESDKPFIEDKFQADIHVKTSDADTEIWIDRELAGTGEWRGKLENGYHILNTRKDGMESESQPLWVEDRSPQEINLETPQSGYGVINVACNVVDADVLIDGKKAGTTPLQTTLPASRFYLIEVRKEGYKSVTTKTVVRGNEMNRIMVKIKKEKHKK